jgi:hypothetical protein
MDKKLATIFVIFIMIASVLLIVPSSSIGEPAAARDITSRVAESEPNDNFTLAQTISGGDVVNGNTGMLVNNPIDVYKINLQAGKVIEVSVQTNSTGFKDLVIHLELYDKWFTPKPIAWSHSAHVWEAFTAIAKYDDWYYIKIIPWKGTQISYDMYVVVMEPPEITDGQFITPPSPLSNMTDNPADWYKMNLNGGQSTNDVMNLTCTFASTEVQFDLYGRDLQKNQWSWWYNFSWWGEFFEGASGPVEEIDVAASYSGYYYTDVQAWNGSGPYTLQVRKKTWASDGDNTYDKATTVSRQPGETQAKFSGEIDMAYDHFDWYKIALKEGQDITASVFLQHPWSPGIYRITIYVKNETTGLLEAWSSWTNIKGTAMTGQAQAFVTDAPFSGDYYIAVIGQVPLDPSNKSNLADWHVNPLHAKYQLVVDLPMDELHHPNIKDGAPTKVDVDEDTENSELKLTQVFDDADIGDPILQDALVYSTAGTYEHLSLNVTNDAEGTVIIKPEQNWNGQTVITFVATDLYGLQNESDITVNVLGENDPPAVLSSVSEILHDFTVKEGTVNQSNNNVVLIDKNEDVWSYKGFTDPDLIYGDVLDFEIVSNQSENAYIPAQLIDQNNYLSLKYQGAKVYNPTGATAQYEVPIQIKATDTSGLSVTYFYNVTVEQNPPEITCLETVITVGEGNSTTRDLAEVCQASTGHDLTFEFLGGNSNNLTVKVDTSGNAKFTALGDYFNVNGENLNFKAYMTQPWAKTTYFTLNVVIENENDDPVITNPQPDPAIAINIPEGGYKDFYATVTDIDNSILDMRYTWYVDNVAIASGANTFRYQPDYEAAGSHAIKMQVRDGSGGQADFTWQVNVDDTNRKPTARITTPQNNTQFDAGKKINFIADASDPDGDPITLIWLENGKEIERFQIPNGTGLHNWEAKFKAGTTHVIELVVTDGELESRYYLTLVIKPKKDDGGIPGFEIMVAIFAMTIVAAVAVRRKD